MMIIKPPMMSIATKMKMNPGKPAAEDQPIQKNKLAGRFQQINS